MYAEYVFQITTLKGMKNLSSPIRVKAMPSMTAMGSEWHCDHRIGTPSLAKASGILLLVHLGEIRFQSLKRSSSVFSFIVDIHNICVV